MKFRPVYLLYLLALLIFLVWSAVVSERTTGDRAIRETAEAERLAKEVAALKEKWQNGKRNQARLDALANGASYREKLKNRKETKGGVRLEFQDLDPDQLSRLVKTVVDGTVEIKELKIRRKSDEAADLSLEVLF